MTIEELLKACANGEMPRVKVESTLKHALSNIGQVVVIKRGTTSWSGCGVQFPGHAWNTWFDAIDGSDGRKHYMKELTLVE